MDEDDVIDPLADGSTTNYGWTKPEVGSSLDTWGDKINADLDQIDTIVHTIDVRAVSQPLPSDAMPTMDGTGAPGVGTTWSRGDHKHPSDSSKYDASNPSGFITAAGLPAPYVLPKATTTVLGGVIPDGTTITVDGTGKISGTPPAAGIPVSDTPPISPKNGDLWFDSVGAQLYCRFNDGTSAQWVVAVNASGLTDAPSDGSLYGRSNAAWTKALPLTGGTLSGSLIVNGPMAVGSPTTDGSINLNSQVGKSSFLFGTKGSPAKTRWDIILGDGSPESGSNAGSNFYIDAYDDSGAWYSTPLSINRATGGAAFASFIVCHTSVQVISSVGDARTLYYDSLSNFKGSTGWRANDNAFYLYNNVSGAVAWLQQTGEFAVTGPAYKPGGGAWLDSSDERIKNVAGPYEAGLDQVLQLNPVVYTFKGNDTPTGALVASHDENAPDTKSAPYHASPHYSAALDQKRYVGFIAQELETVFPEMVHGKVGFIDGQEVSDLKDVDTSALIYALVNAVKTLTARVAELEATR